MRLHRFYIEQPLGEELVVEQKELIHQWLHVFRYTEGDVVILFGSSDLGNDYEYTITQATKTRVALARGKHRENIMSAYTCTLYLSLVKKDTFETAVRQATELGVTRIVPIISARSEKKSLNKERLNHIAQEATEQSGRGSVPHIGEPRPFAAVVADTLTGVHILASLQGKTIKTVTTQDTAPTIPRHAWIGPEGGWTSEEEADLIAAGCVPIKLTETVLKTDTAVVTTLTVLLLT